MKSLTIAWTNIRRLLRQPANYFFVFIFPVLLILVLGATFGGGFTPTVGVISEDVGPLGEELVAELARTEDLDVEAYADEGAMLTAVERGNLQGGLVVPAGYDDAIRSGDQVRVDYYVRPDQLGGQVRTAVEAAVAEQSALLRAARFAAGEAGASFQEGLAAASETAPTVPEIEVRVASAGEALFPEDLGTFDLGASSQLLLFIFLTSLGSSQALIETRRFGVSRRMLSTPTPTRSVILGEMGGRFGVALLQGVFIMVGSLLLFGVSWGDPLGAVALLVAFVLVGAGAGMLMGASFDNEQQAGSVALLLGLGLAALGGAMVPLEVFSDTMQGVAHVTPHAWASDGFAELVRRDGTVVDILPELGVLLAFAAGLLSLATWRLRKAITA